MECPSGLGFLRVPEFGRGLQGDRASAWPRSAVLFALLAAICSTSPVLAQPLFTDPVRTDSFPPVVLDALDCLDRQELLQRERDAILERADSLGFAVELSGPSERAPVLREIEVVKNRYADLGLDLLLRQEACRTLALSAVAECNRVVSRFQSEVGREGAVRERASELSRWLAVRERLEGALTASAVYDYPVLPTQVGETVETTQLKLQYYQEVTGLLRALAERIEVRLDSVRESAEALRDAWQFLEDLSFADMGDPNPSGDALGQTHAGGGGARPESRISLDRSSIEIDFALSGSPTGPEQAQTWIRVLEERRDRVRAVLETMEEQLRLHEARLAAEAP